MKKIILTGMIVLSASIVACSQKSPAPTSSAGAEVSGNAMGVGPIQQKMVMDAISPELAVAGKKVFDEKCSACHKFGERYVGPDLKAVTKRRGPEWIMNMILNPQEMTQKDPAAQELLAIYMTQMTYQNVSQEDARAILEYFRQIDVQ